MAINIKYFIAFMPLLISCNGQVDSDKNEIFESHKDEFPYTDTFYTSTGQPNAIKEYINDSLTITHIYGYHETGVVNRYAKFHNNNKHGIEVFIDPNGDTTSIKTFRKGLKHGLHINYFDSTNTKHQVFLYLNDTMVYRKFYTKQGILYSLMTQEEWFILENDSSMLYNMTPL